MSTSLTDRLGLARAHVENNIVNGVFSLWVIEYEISLVIDWSYVFTEDVGCKSACCKEDSDNQEIP